MHTGYYLTKVSSNPGAGDVLMGFLGPVILSFAFSMFKQRKVTSFLTIHANRSGSFCIKWICFICAVTQEGPAVPFI